MRLALLSFVAGAWLLQRQAQLPHLAWAAGLLPLLGAYVVLSRGAATPARAGVAPLARRAQRAVVLAVALGAGYFWAAALAEWRLADRLPAALEGRDFTVVGVIAGLPQHDERGVRFLFDVERVLDNAARLPRRLSISWYTTRRAGQESPPPRLIPGERWQITLRLKRPHGNINPGGFDFELFALERGIGATGYVRPKAPSARLTELVARPGYLIERWRARVRERLHLSLYEKPYAGVLIALIIGAQDEIPAQQWRIFWRSGTGHLVSISGLHITMLAGLGAAAVYWLWRRSAYLTLRWPARRAAMLAGSAIALAYAALAGFSIPTQRTVFMLLVVAAALWFGWISTVSRVLCLALFAVVLLDPWAVCAPGFWLSFGAIGAIAYVTDARARIPGKLESAVRTQLAVTLILAPLLLLLFQQMPLIAPAANAVAIPLISLGVVPLALLGAATPVELPLQLAHQLLAWTIAPLQWLSALPGATWGVAAPPALTVALALAGMLFLLMPRGVPARWLGLLWIAPLALHSAPRPERGQFWLTVLDVGQGLAVLVQTQRFNLLYDAGPRYTEEADSGNRIVVPFLRTLGIGSLHGMIISHADSDHSGGANSVLDEIAVGWLASSLGAADPLMRRVERSLPCTAGQRWNWDQVNFEILHPDADADGRSNDLSCVMRIRTGDFSVLLPGDIERAAEQRLLEREVELRAKVLLAPHHGSKTSSSAEFIDAVAPQTVVFATGYRNRFSHPAAEVVERYRLRGVHSLRTDLAGAITLRSAGRAGFTVETVRAGEPRYWRAHSTRYGQ